MKLGILALYYRLAVEPAHRRLILITGWVVLTYTTIILFVRPCQLTRPASTDLPADGHIHVPPDSQSLGCPQLPRRLSDTAVRHNEGTSRVQPRRFGSDILHATAGDPRPQHAPTR